MASNPIGPQDALTGVALRQPLSREQTAARVELRRLYLGHQVSYAQLVAAEQSGDPVGALAALTAPPPPPTPEPPEPQRQGPQLRWSERHQQYRYGAD
jgi:hypothetical protein